MFHGNLLVMMDRPPTFQEWSDKLGIMVPQLKQQIRRSHRAKAALIEANLRLVVTVARQTVKQQRDIPLNFQDACQEGMIGLSIACEKFDPEKGEYYSWYYGLFVWWLVLGTWFKMNGTIYNILTCTLYKLVMYIFRISFFNLCRMVDSARSPKEHSSTKQKCAPSQIGHEEN
jgi:DNA-directed RNA polymerase, sigma subunit (sigma70/sigma32)